MFTGIIESLGSIQEINELDSKLELWIAVRTDIWNATDIGDSISVNGVCLTVVKKDEKTSPPSFIFDVVGETLDKTNLRSI